MATLAFDTLAFSKKRRGQFTAEQADTLAEAFVAGADAQLATKIDLREVEQKLTSDIREVELKLDQKIDLRFSQLETRIVESANRTIIWLVGAMFSSAALVVAMIKLLP